jgi:hypothetical protein
MIEVRENILTAVFIGVVLVANLILGVLAIPGTSLVGGLLSPFVNLVLGALGVVVLPWVWSRSNEKIFTLHAVLAILLPYACNLFVWKIACLAYPH